MTCSRRIAVWVLETPEANFRWVITEGGSLRLRDLRRSEHEFLSYEGALTEGADALKNMHIDEVRRPRGHSSTRDDRSAGSRLLRAMLNAAKFFH